MPHNLLTGLSNADYHGNRSHLSSSNLKTLLTSPEQFKHEWIDGNKPVEGVKDHFTEGSFVHALILEPDTIIKDYAIFPGMRKAGGMWEAFKEEHGKTRTIITAAQVFRCEKLFDAYKSNKLATEVLEGALPEHSMISTWLDVPVKCRYDGIIPKSHIVDIKTTSQPTDIDLFRHTVQQFRYDLSAALYAQIAYNVYGVLHDYYWVVLSKADQQCAVYKASSATLAEGAALCVQALVTYKKCLESGIWTIDNNVKEFSQEIQEI
jgi:hypothetical protein